jgi:hypothetical protein
LVNKFKISLGSFLGFLIALALAYESSDPPSVAAFLLFKAGLLFNYLACDGEV